MQVIVDIPEEVAQQLPDVHLMPRQLLEAWAAEAYRSEKLTRHQIGRLLGLNRWKTEDFLATHKAIPAYSLADWEIDRPSLEQQ